MRLAAGGHLEDEAVRLGRAATFGRTGEVGPDVGTVDRLLAGDPAAPWHRPAGAVHLGAVEARERPDDLAVLGDDDRGCAARVPSRRTARRCRRAAERRPGIVDLVVADEDHVAVPASESSHAVVTTGQRCAVVERRPAPPCRGTSGTGTPVAATAGRCRRGGRVSGRAEAGGDVAWTGPAT